MTYPVAGTALVAGEPAPPTHRHPRLLDQVRDAVRARHYAPEEDFSVEEEEFFAEVNDDCSHQVCRREDRPARRVGS